MKTVKFPAEVKKRAAKLAGSIKPMLGLECVRCGDVQCVDSAHDKKE